MNGKHLAILMILLFLTSSALLSHSSGLVDVSAQGSLTNIVSYRVNGSPDYNLPGTEPFWNSISWTVVPLAASVSPGGGHTSNLLIKSANDGFNVYVLFSWNDTQGPSFGSSSESYIGPNGNLLPLTPENTANVTQLFYNSTYYYPDRAAVLWFEANPSQRGQFPKMDLGTNGAMTDGAADIWHWQSVPTDNSPNDTGFPGGYTDPSGHPIFPPDNVSFAEDDYTNKTGFYVIAGNFGYGVPNLSPYADPYIVRVGSDFSFRSKTWTIEMVRSFTTDEPNYMVQLKAGSTYYVAFAVWNGKVGESSEFKSVSQWYSLTISDTQPSIPTTSATTSQTTGGISFETAAVVSLGMVVVGFIAGLVVLSKFTFPKPKT